MSDPEENFVDWTTVYRYHVHRLCYNNWVVLYFFNDFYCQLTTRRKVSMMKNTKFRGTNSRTGNSRVISLPRRPNLKRNVFQIRKKNQNMKQKCITTWILWTNKIKIRGLPKHCETDVLKEAHVRTVETFVLSESSVIWIYICKEA